MSIDRNAAGPEATASSGLFAWCAARRKSTAAALVLAAGAGAGVGGLTLASGCQTLGPIIAPAVVRACIDIIRGIFNLPLLDLPPGFVPCGPVDRWEERGIVTEFCFYCSAADPYTVYVQPDCQGPYFPMKARPVGSTEPLTYDEAISLEKFTCEERFLRRAQSAYDGFHGRLQTSIKSPNNRMLPDPSAYPSLTVLIDGERIIARTDFPVRFGETIELIGTVDEVAHYAMTAGVTELSFRDGNDRYEVLVNPRFSAKLVFKNGECIEKGLLFAPTP
jgi:hypothetical protein